MAIPVVMHNRSAIVRDTIGLKFRQQFEVDVRALGNVTPVDSDILVTIRSTLDMELSKGMNKLMLNGSGCNRNFK